MILYMKFIWFFFRLSLRWKPSVRQYMSACSNGSYLESTSLWTALEDKAHPSLEF